jgi:hypothetical protein
MCRRFGTLCSIFIKYRRQGITQKKEHIIIITITTKTTTINTTNNMARCGKMSPFSEAVDRSAIQEIPHILWHPKAHCHVHTNLQKNLSLD